MKCGAAIALLAAVLIVPAFGQHPSAHGGFSGHAGYAARSGISGFRGGSISRPSAPGRFGFERPGFRAPGEMRSNPPFRSGFSAPSLRRPGMNRPTVPYRPGINGRLGSGSRSYRGRRINPYQPGLQSGLTHRTGNWDHDRYRSRYDGEHHRGGDHYRRDYDGDNFLAGSYGYAYPGYLGYPYPFVLDQGFYDWSDSSDSGSDQGYASPDQGDAAAAYDQAPQDYGYASPGYDAPPAYPEYLSPYPYPSQDPRPAAQPPANSTASTGRHASASSESEMNPPLTVIFKDGRKPEQIQNYMLSATVLTDLDRQHYQQIPLDQINIAATQQANLSHGIDFRVPAASRD